ncbi:MAG: matrixin family metalloprotease, partial [Myxococcota bacterium]|nr:matrixin family metalloprotease [Myxococcota bacterium]
MRRVAAAAALACVAAEASAYTTMTSPASRWPRTRMPVPWYIHEAGSADLGIDVSERETRAGFNNWENVGCAYITFGFQGRTSRRAESSRGMNVMSWTESGWRHESYTLAVTQNWFGRGTIEESDIECNGTTVTWNTTGGRGIDTQSIMTHEAGHFLGLGHTSVRGATMYASYSGGTAERSLDADDIEGVCFLYPDDSGGCTTDGDCPTGYRCSGGSCVPNPTGDGLMCAPCSSSVDCREGLCLSGFPDGGTYCGKNCTSDAQCGTGNRCWPVSGGSSQCAPADGDCTPEPTGCTTDGDCPTGQRCEPPNCVPVTPRPDCTVDSDCSGGLVCRDGRCVTPPDPGLRGFGEPCGDGSQCQTGLCLDGYCTRSCPSHQPLGTCPDGYYCDALSCGE